MKKTAYFVAAAMFLGSFTLHAQETTTDTTAKNHYTYVTAKRDLTSKFLPMPDSLTIEKIFPVTGMYMALAPEAAVSADMSVEANAQAQATVSDVPAEVSIVLDSANNGIVWITGLPQGKIKALLRQSPATYKIPAQKTEEGKQVAEGTLVYDKDANVLNICIGCEYNDAEPAKPFTVATDTEENTEAAPKKNTKTKSSKKVWKYTGAKVIVEEPVVEEVQEEEAPARLQEAIEEQQ